MPDAAYYCRQSQLLRSTASKATDHAVAARLRSLAEDYQAIAALMTDKDEPAWNEAPRPRTEHRRDRS
jgi:hypothetical protein